MGDVERQYRDILKKYCEKVTPEYFPGLETSDLMRREITLEDVYVPLTLWGVEFFEERIQSKQFRVEKERLSGEDLQQGNEWVILEDEYDVDESEEELQIDNRKDLYITENAKKYTAESIIKYIPENTTKEFCEKNGDVSTGMRALLMAPLGGGKTFFCRRLILAYLKNEVSFFKQGFCASIERLYDTEKLELEWENNTFPLFLNCKNIREMSEKELEDSSFSELVYKLCSMEFGEGFRPIGYENFGALLERKAGEKCCLILDGWNEIQNAQKERRVWRIIKKYLREYPMMNLILAVRTEYECPADWEWTDFSHFLRIKKLTDEETTAICEKWYQVVFHDNAVKQKEYNRLTEQVLQSPVEQIKEMAQIPLMLSILLAVSRYNTRLPENMTILFQELFRMYLLRNMDKGRKRMSPEAMTLYFAYIAACFTKREISLCSYSELSDIIRQCNIDLRNVLPSETDDYEIPEVIEQLSVTGVFGMRDYFPYYGGYTFLPFDRMQEYLTAYAVLTQSADKEYNSMEPEEILKDKYNVVTKKNDVKEPVFRVEDKYNISGWKDVIVFAALMDTGKLRYTIIKKLLKRAKKTRGAYIAFNAFIDESEETELDEMAFCIYRDMLNEILAGVPDISSEYRQKINEIIIA